MIVVDTYIITSLVLPTAHSERVSRLHAQDPAWEAPLVWQGEFLDVLAGYCRRGLIGYHESLDALDLATRLIGARAHHVPPGTVLDIALNSSCSAHDGAFIALARSLGAVLITCDDRIIQEFSDIAMNPESYLARCR